MKDRIYVATFAEDAEETIKEWGVNIEFNHICISECLDSENIEKTIDEMKKYWKDCEAQSAVIHGPFTEIIPAGIDHRMVEAGFERLEEAYEVCSKLGIKRMIVHTGFVPLMYHKEWHIEKSRDFWKSFLKDKPADFKILIENVFEDEPYMMKDLIDAIDDSRAAVCLDVGHANAMTKKDIPVEAWVEVLGERIEHIHIHNNDGSGDTHCDIDQGTMEWKKILNMLDIYAKDGYTVTVESRQAMNSVKLLLDDI